MMMKPPYPPNFPPHCPPSGINNPQAIDFNDLAHYDTRIKQYIDEHDASIKESVYTKSEIDNMLNGCATEEELDGVKEKITDLSIKLSSQQTFIDAVKEDNVRHEELIHEQNNEISAVSERVASVEAKVDFTSDQINTIQEVVLKTSDALDAFRVEIENSYSTKDETEQKFSDVKSYTDKEVDALRAELLGIDVSDAYNSFREIQDHIKLQDSELKEIEKRLDKADSKDYVTTAELKETLSDYVTEETVSTLTQTFSTRISGLEITDATHTAKISSIEDDLSKVEAHVEKNRVDILELSKSVGEITSGASERYATKEHVKAVKDDLIDRIDATNSLLEDKSSKEELAAQTSILRTNINVNATEIVNIKNTVNRLSTKVNHIDSVVTNVASISTDVENIKETISVHQENIVANHNAIDSLQQTVATVVANAEHTSKNVDRLGERVEQQDQIIYQTHLDLDEVKQDYATKSYVDAAIGNIGSLNNVLFNDGEKVGVTLGGFTKGDSVSGLTIKQILTKLLQIQSVTPPDEPDIPEEPTLPPVVQEIVDNRLPVHDLDDSGNLVSKEFVEQTWTEAQAKLDSNETCFYHVSNGSGNIIESGYQVNVALQSTDWLTVAIPDIITDFYVEQYDVMLGDWMIPNWSLEKTDKYSVPGCNVYTVPEQYQIASGITIRIVIKD